MSTRNSHLATLGLVRNPFPYTPDAGSYFLTSHLEEQFVELAHCIVSRKGFCLLTAEVGMGKSTLVRRLMADLQEKNVVSALVFNTFLQGQELLAAILQDFGLISTGTMSSDIAALNAFLLQHHREGKTCLLIIDDAQNLSTSSLELIRLLCNLETDQEKLLQILIAGQTELEDMLSQHGMRQLRSRVAKHSRLHGLSSTEIADYVKFRFDSAGSDGSIVLQADACQALWKATQGVPRQIHVVMDRCLYGLAAKSGNVIDLPLMRKALQDSQVDLIQRESPVAASGTGAAARSARVPVAAVVAGLVIAVGAGAGGLWLAKSGGSASASTGPLVANAAASESATEKPRPEGASKKAPAESTVALAAPTASGGEAAANAAVIPAPPVDASGTKDLPVSPVAPGAAQPVAPSGVTERFTSAACTPRAGWPGGRIVVSQPLSELTQRLLGERLSRLEDVCIVNQQGQMWLSWSTSPGGYIMKQRSTVAQMQIALTHYGSLVSQSVDGVWGEKSQQALRQFQAGLGLAATGEVDALSGLLLEKFYAQER